MTLYALTGTPGTGKSSVSEELRSRGYKVVDGKRFIIDKGLMGEYDEERDTYEVDLDDLNEALERFRAEDGPVIFDSHLSHFMDSSGIIVLRCSPDELKCRLGARGYPEGKIRENIQAEILDEILFEASETDIPIAELDSSRLSIGDIATAIEKIICGDWEDYPPGDTDWSQETEKWF